MLKNMKIGTKLSIAFLGITLLFTIAGIVFVSTSGEALSTSAFNQLESIREDKKARVEDFFTERKSDMHILLETIGLFRQNAFQKLESVREHKRLQLEHYFHERLLDITLASQSVSISQALNQFEEALHSDGLEKEKIWQTVEKQFEVELRKFQDEHDYHNLFLIAKDGHVVYSVYQSSVVGKNVMENELKESPLNSAFQNGLKGVTVQDFTPCVLSKGNKQVIFFAVPVFLDEKLIGVLLLCVTPEQINRIVQQRHGLGKTGEAYLIGTQNGKTIYRSNRIVKGKGKNIVGTEKSGDDIDKAFSGQTGTKLKMGSTGKIEISSYTSLQIPGLHWAIVVTMSLEEAITPILKGEQQEFFAKYTAQYSYYDLFLIHPEGQIFYTIAHESDYNTNILTGRYANSGLGQLVQEVLKTKTFGMSDYAPYAPSNGEPAFFIASPLIHNDIVEMVVAVQISEEKISHIMHQRSGMGKTGEAYLIGSDKLMRSNSFLDPVNRSIKASFANPAIGAINTESSRAALLGNTDIQIIKDYRNQSVLSAYTPIKVGNTTWALLVEIDEAEAFAKLIRLEWSLGIIAVICVILIISIAWWLTRSIKYPLAHLVTISKEITAGNLNNQITITGKDEIGQLLQAFSDMQTQLRAHLEQDINKVIQAISQGNLEERIVLDNKTGFFKTLSESINQIVALNQSIIEDIMLLLSALAQGDLTQCIENNYAGAFERLKDDANATVVRLTEIMTEISRSAEIVNNAAEEITQGNLSFSQRTEEQAASLEETAASMEQMTSTVQQNSDNTKQANQLALSAKQRAEKGGEVVNATVNAMTEISHSSKKIVDIISVIDEIAFQTNLLALNAAVEAARAGDQGRGFAVVASEVRSLAQRSAAAAKEIKELIQDSVAKVEEGRIRANQSGETLEEIVMAVKKVSDIISEISAAGQEQSSGINQINKVITQMDEMTQQNASLVEEAATASESMKEQAKSLKEQVMFFNLGQEIVVHRKNTKTTPKKNQPRSSKPSRHQDEDGGWEEF